MKSFFRLALITCLILFRYHVFAQTDTAFWFVAPDVCEDGTHLLDRPVSLHLATFSLPSTVTISQPANSAYFTPITVTLKANSSTTVDLTPYIDSIENAPANIVHNYGIYIQSTSKITVYYEVLGGATSCGYCNPESFSLKGHNALGTSFYTPFQQTYDNATSGYLPTPYSAFDIVAPQDSTQVTINPTQNIVGHTAGTAFTVNLNKGQTFSCTATSQSAANHPSGSYVTSNKPVAITVKDDLIDIVGQDLAGDQIIPTNILGDEYIVVQAPSAYSDLAIVVGTQAGTQISVNGSLVTTIGAGQTYQYALSSSTYGADYITSTLPVYVFQLTTADGEAGGAILPPLDCTGSTDVSVTRATPNPFNAFLITQNGNQGNFLCNGSTTVITSTAFTSVPGTSGNWVYAVVDLSSFISADSACRIINTTGLFSLGILEGIYGGSNYAYFSDFVTKNNTLTAVNLCSPDSAILHPTVAGTHLWSDGSTADSLVVDSAGTYWVQNAISGCLFSDTFKVTTGLLPIVAVAPSNPTTCIGKSVLLTASGATSYQWSPSSSLSSSSGSLVTATPTITTTYTITGVSSSGCTNTIKSIVTVDSLPTLNVSPGSSSICDGQSVILNAKGASLYKWSPATGLSSSSGTSVTASPTITTTYTTTGLSTACADSVTEKVIITVNPTPVITASPTTNFLCYGQNVNIISNGANAYQWAPSAGLSATTGSSVTATPTTSTTYTIIGISLGCSDSLDVVVKVDPQINFSLNPFSPSICQGQSVNLNANTPDYSYAWSPATGLSATTGSSVTATPSVTTSYTITASDTAGCSVSTSFNISVNPVPTVIVSPITKYLCYGQSDTLNASGAVSFQWSPAAGLSSTSDSTVIANPINSTTYTVVGTSNGCSDTTKSVVKVDSPIIFTLTPNTSTICNGENVALNVTGGNYTYEWSPAIGLSSTSGSSIIANPTLTTTYSVSVLDSSGCTKTSSVTVTVNPIPVITITPSSDLLCYGQNVALMANGANSYQWSPATGLSSTTGASVTANPIATTTYTTIGNSLGCTDTVSVIVTVDAPILFSITALSSSICIGQSTNIGLNSSGNYSYEWSPAAGLNTTTGTSVVASPTTTTSYIIAAKDSNGCIKTSQVVINVNTLPDITVAPLQPTICDGEAINLTAYGATSFQWSPSTGLNATSGSSVSADPSISTTYTVVGTDTDGCSNDTTINLEVGTMPKALFTILTPNICQPQQIQLSNNSTGASNYFWLFGDGDTSAAINPIHNYASSGTYTVKLIVTSIPGCADTLSFIVPIVTGNDLIAVPSAFTPNQATNGYFAPIVLCSTSANYLFRVYDRWGRMLYETTDPAQSWDGKYKGIEQPLDVYVYYVELTCGQCKIFKKGDVTLIR